MDWVEVSELRQNRYFASFPAKLAFLLLPDPAERLGRGSPDHSFAHFNAEKSKDSFSDDSRGSSVEVEVHNVALE